MIRRAIIKDAKNIHGLIDIYARKEYMLKRSVDEICRSLRDYFVFYTGNTLAGVCALHISGETLAEVRSLAVRDDSRGRGIGKTLVERCLKDAQELGVKRVFALTYIPDFFKKLDFREADKSLLPQKIWQDCITCKKFPECDETAVIKDL